MPNANSIETPPKVKATGYPLNIKRKMRKNNMIASIPKSLFHRFIQQDQN